jgi:hypothetical protein
MTDLANAPQNTDDALSARLSRIVRECPECGTSFSPPVKGPGQHQEFCSDAHRIAFKNREKAQGSVLITVAKAWRKARGSGEIGKAAFAEMTAILDQLLDDDRKAGRRLPEGYMRRRLAVPYMDRRN